MFKLFNFNKKKADKLHALAQDLDSQGLEEDAIEQYQLALSLDPTRSNSLARPVSYTINMNLTYSK